MPIDKLLIELSHSWYDYTLELQENSEFDISIIPEDEKNLKDDNNPQIPAHVLRGKVYYDLASDWKFSLAATYATKHWVKIGSVEPKYEYDLQRFDPLFGDGGNQAIIGGQQASRVILNLRIDKFFFENKLNVYLFGNDILSSVFAEGANQFETVYPRQVSGIFGLGLKYILN